MNKLTILALSIPILAASGCNSSVQTGSGGAGGSGSTGSSTFDSSSTTGTPTGGGPTGCPAAEPSAGASCAGVTDGLHCTYGDSTRPECRDEWICQGGMWNTTGSVCAMSTACGTTEPAMGTVCSMEGAHCSFGNDICICSSCSIGPCMAPPPKWTCAGPPTTAGCPPKAPNDGTACTQEGLSCTYGIPCGGSGVTADCKGGAWTWDTAIACPD